MCKIKLIGAELSKINLYPGERLYVKCTFQALEDMPIDQDVSLFADFCFGHMFIDKKEATYYRATASMYPSPAHLRKGEIWSYSVIWNIPNELWGGAYKVYVGIMDDNTVPISFFVNNDTYKRYYITDVNIAFSGVAEEYMNTHSEGAKLSYASENISCAAYDHSLDAVISVRDTTSDEEIKSFVCLKANEIFSNDYVSFVLRKSEEAFFIENITEKSGYELLYVKLPLMFTLSNAKMITMYGEGRAVSPESYPWGYEQAYWIRNAAILTNGVSSIVIETPFLDDKLHHSVCELNDNGFCAVGVTFTYRIRAYKKMESIKVINVPTVTVKQIGGGLQNCLSFLRKGIIKKTDMYDRSLFYYNNLCQGPGRPAQTFDSAIEKIKKIYRLTGGVKQYMLICGWQHEGHDTGYPDVFEINKKCGTIDDLKRCADEAKKYNACFIFHDNYDDMYEENGYFDKEIAAAAADGKYYSSWIWTSGVSVMTSYPKYFKTGKAQERVRKTVEMLPINKSYHIDVLSQEVRRYDFAQDIKSAAQETLEYKLAVIKEFEKYGITVTSEGLTHPFAGKIGYAWRLNINKNKLFSSEKAIPLTAMIYHGLVPYSGNGNDAVIFGANMTPGKVEDDAKFTRDFFTKTLPIGILCNEFMENYRFDNGVHYMDYSDNSHVIYDEVNDTVEVVYNGECITHCGMTLVKGYNENEYLGYSENGAYKMKNTLKKPILDVLNFAGEKLEYTVDEYIEVCCEKGTPFKIILKD